MIRSIILTALRNISRHLAFSLINLIGLGVSMSLCLLIILIVNSQYGFDTFHPDADRIYRINTRAIRVDGDTEPYASTPLPLGQVLVDEYSFAEEVVRLNRHFSGDVEFSNSVFPLRGLYADPSFFSVFGFQFERGQASTALNSASSIVLTHESAEKIFGKAEPLGQVVEVKGVGNFTVSAVLAPFPNTHLEFDMLAPFEATATAGWEDVRRSADDWNNYYSGHIYLKLKPAVSVGEVESALSVVSARQYANLKLETRDKGYEFYLQALDEITPGPILSNNMGRGMPSLLIVMLSSLAGVIMLMACFNYTSLTIAKSLSRAREIGVRKVVGAGRLQVFAQFVGESVVFAMISLAVGYLLLQVIKPGFSALHLAGEFDIGLEEAGSEYMMFILFAVVAGVIAGLLPAGYLSAFRPTRVLKSSVNLKVYSRLTLRKTLMVAQFALSLTFILLVAVVYNQVRFMFEADYGFEERNTLLLRLQGQPFESVAAELRSLPGVERVGGVSHSLGTWEDGSDDYRATPEGEPFTVRDFRVDENYLVNLGITFVAGNNFNGARVSPAESEAIINERALQAFGFPDAASAVGQSIIAGDSVSLRVVGVVPDFHFRPLTNQIGPLVIRQRPEDSRIASIRIQEGREQEVQAAVEQLWKRRDPVHAIRLTTQEHELDSAYERSGITDVVTVVGYIAFLALVLACLGMLGMAMYATQTRIKEIGVRKVMGAGTWQIAWLLSRSFMVLIAAGVAIGLPLGLQLSDLLLSNYAFRIDVSFWLGAMSVLLLGALGLVTIGSQTFAAARQNPVNTLRYE